MSGVRIPVPPLYSMNLEKKFLYTVRKFNLISKGDKVLIAFSGGPDSVLLASLLIKFKNYLGIEEVGLAHLNHLLRPDAGQDEEFSISFADKNSLRIFTKRVDVKALAKSGKRSVEDVGREERYRFLRETASREGFNKIATAHHLSDLAETMTLWFLQGSKKGLKGFKPLSGDIIRPLYYLTKEEIVEYCKKNNLNFVVDLSNLSEKYLRNRIRLKVIPVLKEVNTSLEASLERMSYFINLDEEYFDRRLEELSSGLDGDFLPKSKLEGLDDAIVYRLFQRWLDINGVVISYQQLRSLLEFFHSPDGKISLGLGKGKRLIFTGEGFKLVEHLESRGFKYKLKVGERLYIKEADVWIESFRSKAVEIESLKKDENVECFDLEGEEFTVRSKEEGDKMVPFGHKSERKIKDIFIDMKIPKYKRNSIPLVVFGDKILWVCGYKRSALYPLTDGSKDVVCFRLLKEV